VNVFVAGATGALGRVLVPMLVERGHDVVGMTRSRPDVVESLGATPVVADAFDAEAVRAAVEAAGPDVVVDQLTDLPGSFPTSRAKLASGYAANNRIRREGSGNVFAAAAGRRFVAQSVCFFYAGGNGWAGEGEPLAVDAPSPVGESVAAIPVLESRVLGGGGVVLRYGQFYGPGTWFAPDGSVADMVRAGRYPIIGSGAGRAPFVHVEDAAAVTLTVIEDPSASGVYNVCGDDQPLVREWLPTFASALGARRPRKVPAFLARLVAGPAAVWFSTQVRGADNSRAKTDLGFAPRPLALV
jgi:nucleoside-diphosphate-sugar epimerase